MKMIDTESSVFSHLRQNCPEQLLFSKRSFDIFFSLIILLLILPLIIIIALLIALTSRGPIFYPSRRIGAGGKIINCWKFRTMHRNAEERLKELLASSAALQKEWQQHYKLKNDPRITKVGSFLRKTSLDELPQFWNVLKGDMSTVGPRPLSVDEVSVVIEKGKDKIFSVKPGITGLWQTSGRSLIPFDQRIAIEESYVAKRSFWLDLYLIMKTIPRMIFTKGAF